MNKEQILKECIKIAVKNGWDLDDLLIGGYLIESWLEGDKDYLYFSDYDIASAGDSYAWDLMFFDHEFCRKLFGEEKLGEEMFDTVGYDGVLCGSDYQSEYGGYDVMFIGESWKYHIQELAVSTDRIKYLGEWLKTQK